MFSRIMIGIGIVSLSACNLKIADTTDVETGPTCDLKLSELAGTEWVYAEALPNSAGEKPQYKTRARFEDKDGALGAKYTVSSLSDVYDYDCEMSSDEKEGLERMICKQKSSIDDFCMAMMAGGERCVIKPMQRINSKWTAEEIEATATKTKASIAEMKEKGVWDQMRVRYNSLLNKIQGVLYIEVQSPECRLKITDNYLTVYNGVRIEDSNPAGINPYNKNEGKGLLFESCTAPFIFDTDSAEFPEKPGEVTMSYQVNKTRQTGEEINFWMLYGDLRLAQEGCSYSYDVWINYQLVKQGIVPETIDIKEGKELRWNYAHTFNEKSHKLSPHVLTFDIKKSCGEKEERIIACNAVVTD